MDFRSCNQPWFEMQLMYNQQFRTCCYYANELTQQTLNIPAIWHGEYFKGLRSLISGGDPSNSHCEHCDYIKYFDAPMFLDIPAHVTGARRRNWERALEHHRNGTVDIDTFPVKYYMQFGIACNLRCTMCNHPQRYIDGESSELSAEKMLAMSEYLKLAESIHVIGGEPLIIPNAIQFMEGVVARPDLHDLQYNIYTNALLLGQFIETFLPLERVAITASIDSSGAGYEAIRRRSSWETVTTNLTRFAQTARTHDRPGWSVTISTILMKSSLRGLPDLVSWCIDNGFPTNIVNIGALDGLRNDDEHIFRNPALLDEVPGWESELTCAMEQFSKAGRVREARRLERAITELTDAVSRQQTKRAQARSVSAGGRWKEMFTAGGQELVDRLVTFFYGRRQPEGTMTLNADGIQFTPTHMRDHLATRYMAPVPSDSAWVRVVHEWTAPYADVDPHGCIVVLQDEQCFELEVDHVDVDRGDVLSVTQYVRLPPKVGHVRVRLTLPSMQCARLPDRLRLEQHHQSPLMTRDGELRVLQHA